MKMKLLLTTFFLSASALSTICLGEDVSNVNTCKGIWSSDAVSPYVISANSITPISNLDKSISIKATDEGLFFSIENKPYELIPIEYSPPLAEILWSPNNQGFGINTSDGGTAGSWSTDIYFQNSKGALIAVDIKKIISPT